MRLQWKWILGGVGGALVPLAPGGWAFVHSPDLDALPVADDEATWPTSISWRRRRRPRRVVVSRR